MKITYLEKDPSKIHVMNNYCLVEFYDDDIQKSKYLQIVKRNNSSVLRSIYVGKLLQRPDFMQSGDKSNIKFDLSKLVCDESIIAYNPMSISVEVTWDNKKYHIIRVEDIYCALEGYQKPNN